MLLTAMYNCVCCNTTEILGSDYAVSAAPDFFKSKIVLGLNIRPLNAHHPTFLSFKLNNEDRVKIFFEAEIPQAGTLLHSFWTGKVIVSAAQ